MFRSLIAFVDLFARFLLVYKKKKIRCRVLQNKFSSNLKREYGTVKCLYSR